MVSSKLKPLFVAVVALSLVAAPVAAAPISNYVDNPGFETFEDGDPADWRVLAGDPSATEDAAEGQRAVLFNLRGSETESTIAQNVSEETDDAVVGGYEYDLEFSAKYSSGSDTNATNVTTARAVVLWKNAAGQVVDRDVVTVESGGYRTYDRTFRAPVDATDAELRFTLQRQTATDRTDATLKVDDVAFGPSNQQ